MLPSTRNFTSLFADMNRDSKKALNILGHILSVLKALANLAENGSLLTDIPDFECPKQFLKRCETVVLCASTGNVPNELDISDLEWPKEIEDVLQKMSASLGFDILQLCSTFPANDHSSLDDLIHFINSLLIILDGENDLHFFKLILNYCLVGGIFQLTDREQLSAEKVYILFDVFYDIGKRLFSTLLCGSFQDGDKNTPDAQVKRSVLVFINHLALFVYRSFLLVSSESVNEQVIPIILELLQKLSILNLSRSSGTMDTEVSDFANIQLENYVESHVESIWQKNICKYIKTEKMTNLVSAIHSVLKQIESEIQECCFSKLSRKGQPQRNLFKPNCTIYYSGEEFQPVYQDSSAPYAVHIHKPSYAVDKIITGIRMIQRRRRQQIDYRFERFAPKIISCGSLIEGCYSARTFAVYSDNTLEHEIDLMYEFGTIKVAQSHLLEPINDRRAFVNVICDQKLKWEIHKILSLTDSSFMFLEGDNIMDHFIKSRSTDNYLSSLLFRKAIARAGFHVTTSRDFALIQRCMSVFKTILNKSMTSFEKQEVGKVASTLSSKLTLDGITYICSVDNVPALKLEFWPEAAKEWLTRTNKWFDSKEKKDISSKGCHIVCKSSNVDGNGDDWRFSFSLVEIDLMDKLTDNQKNRYYLFKSMYYKYIHGITEHLSSEGDKVNSGACFHSYLVKTSMFWLCEKYSPEDQIWNVDHLISCVTVFLVFLKEHFQNRNLPNYFIPSHNLLLDIPAHHLESAVELLQNMERNVCMYIPWFQLKKIADKIEKSNSDVICEVHKVMTVCSSFNQEGNLFIGNEPQ